MSRSLLWFRQDLRLKDNPALVAACLCDDVLPVYIIDDTNSEDMTLGEASAWWLHHALASLQADMAANILVLKGDPAAVIPKLVAQYDCSEVHWNRCYQPWQITRDTAIKEALKSAQVSVSTHNGSLLWEPWQILKKDGTPYKVFTPYYRRGCLSAPSPALPVAKPDNIQWVDIESSTSLESHELLPKLPWGDLLAEAWQPGETGAADNLSCFLENGLDGYKDDRNLPAHRGTSRLSPHLRFGEISVRQVWYAALTSRDNDWGNPGLDCFLSELGWREFSYYLLFHFPTIQKDNFQAKFNGFPWADNEQLLTAWQRGNTGYPIVDAGMRELYQTGYMHNRVRMIVGSFLVKNLLQDWRHGERWFWDTLVDADMASNSAGWQWVAGSGADASPYFRIFNPLTQGEKFDKEGEYVSRYCPELAALPKKFIHRPFEAPADILNHCNVVLGHNYPKPVVDLKQSRQKALDAFASIRGN